MAHIAPMDHSFIGYKNRRLLSTVNKSKLQRILQCMLDENEFLGPHGIRSVSRYHLQHPYSVQIQGQEYGVQYLPAESNTGMFGGNSNWRGPVWMPVNQLIVRGLFNLYQFYGDDFKVECPTGSGKYMTLLEVAREISRRLTGIFLRDSERKTARLWRNREVSNRPLLERLHSLLRILSWRQRRRARGKPPDGMDRNDCKNARPPGRRGTVNALETAKGDLIGLRGTGVPQVAAD